MHSARQSGPLSGLRPAARPRHPAAELAEALLQLAQAAAGSPATGQAWQAVQAKLTDLQAALAASGGDEQTQAATGQPWACSLSSTMHRRRADVPWGADVQKAGGVEALLLCLEQGGGELLVPSCRALALLLATIPAREDFARAQGTQKALKLLGQQGELVMVGEAWLPHGWPPNAACPAAASCGDAVAALAAVIQAAATQHEQAKIAAVDGGVGAACVRLLASRELSAPALVALASMLRVFCKADDSRPVASRLPPSGAHPAACVHGTGHGTASRSVQAGRAECLLLGCPGTGSCSAGTAAG